MPSFGNGQGGSSYDPGTEEELGHLIFWLVRSRGGTVSDR